MQNIVVKTTSVQFYCALKCAVERTNFVKYFTVIRYACMSENGSVLTWVENLK